VVLHLPWFGFCVKQYVPLAVIEFCLDVLDSINYYSILRDGQFKSIVHCLQFVIKCMDVAVSFILMYP
jgi:hypothetical protein